MNISKLIQANSLIYRRYYILIITAIIIMTAVITGSFAIGDSVRNTLINRVKYRLGNTETIIYSKNSFFNETLAYSLGKNVSGILLVNGFVSDKGRYIPVMVWGVDSTFQTDIFIDAYQSASSQITPLINGTAVINHTLAKELNYSAKELVLRLPSTGLVPSGSLFVTKTYTTSMRLTVSGIAEPDLGGDISLKNEQIIPCNIFVNRSELASLLNIDGKINLILSSMQLAEDDLNYSWTPYMSGIKVDGNIVTSDRVFLQNEVVENIVSSSSKDGKLYNNDVNRIFAYLANSLSCKHDTVPYSFVAAVDNYNNITLNDYDIILSDYTAKRLHVAIGDTIRMKFYVSEDLKKLQEKEVLLRIVEIVPTEKLMQDSILKANFPGLSDVENCTDWDSDLPIDMNRIETEDEDYWNKYRVTPKALVPYKTLAPYWSNSYGCATAIQLNESPDLSHLTPSLTGINLIHPREASLNAAKNGINFTMLFFALGIFIIIAAILLLLTPLTEMLFNRRNEFVLLSAIGFSRSRIVSILWKESVQIAFIASVLGVIAGIIYNTLIILLLNTLWNDAVHSSDFNLYIGADTIILGLSFGFVITLLVLRITLVKAANKSEKPILTNNKPFSEVPVFSFNRLIRADLYFNRKRAWLSFIALLSGSLIVFFTGLNRRSFNDVQQLQNSTGGYTLWAETSVPVYHNINTETGRNKLSLRDLPDNTKFLQLLRYSADDASCLNLNKISQPTVLGVDCNELLNNHFDIKNSIYTSETNVIKAVSNISSDDSCVVYPALIDETTLLWGLQRTLGDTLEYENNLGKTIKLQLVATLHNSVFQGNILIEKELFKKIWSDITGSEIALIQTDYTQTEVVKMLIEQALSEYGVRVMPTASRLKEFNSVTDTYLTIFLVLGGLGLLLGLFCFIIVVRKDLASRIEQILLLRALGYTDARISQLLATEIRIIPVAAITFGFVLSLFAIIGGITNVSLGVWFTTIFFAVFFVVGVWIFVKKQILNILSAL